MPRPDSVTTIPEQDLAHLVLVATRAPSIHNTQPWTVVPSAHGVTVRADRSRQLRVLDPTGRQLTVSCGALVHHLELVAHAMGLDVTTELLPDPSDPDLLAELRLRRARSTTTEQVDRAVALLHRHTFRGRFTPERVPADAIDGLRHAAESHGAMLRPLHDSETAAVAVLVEHAEQDLLHLPGYREELAAHVWPDQEAPTHSDGMPLSAVAPGADRGEEIKGRRFPPASASRGAPPPVAPPVAERPVVVLLTTIADTTHDWVTAGRALSAVLVEATRSGLVAQPLGQATDLPSARTELRSVLGIIGVPQLLLRLGYAEVQHPTTPRRGVDDVLTLPDDAEHGSSAQPAPQVQASAYRPEGVPPTGS